MSIFWSYNFSTIIDDLPNDVICDITIYADDATLYSKCDKASDLCQQLELDSEIESDLWGIVDWDRKWLVDFIAGKIHIAIDMNVWVCSWGKFIF